MEECQCGFIAEGAGLGERERREAERPVSVIPALPPATVSESFPIPVPLPRALALFFSRAAQGRSCFSLRLFSALYREALTLAGALITAVVQTINSRETKNYAAR